MIERTYEIIFYCPNRDLSNLYKELSNRIAEQFPEKMKEYNFVPPVISSLFNIDAFVDFQELSDFIVERNKKLVELGMDEEEVDQTPSYEYVPDSRTFNYNGKIFASVNVSCTRLNETITGIFNFFNGVFPNMFRAHLFFPDNLINLWNTFDQVVVESGPLSFPKRLIVGLLVSICYDCKYVYNLLYSKYESWGTSMKYLSDPTKFPEEIKAARELIARLAMNPCSLMGSVDIIEMLISSDTKHPLTTNQLLHIGSLVSVFSSMCTLAESLKIQSEVSVCYIATSEHPDSGNQQRPRPGLLFEKE